MYRGIPLYSSDKIVTGDVLVTTYYFAWLTLHSTPEGSSSIKNTGFGEISIEPCVFHWITLRGDNVQTPGFNQSFMLRRLKKGSTRVTMRRQQEY
jgi:hypothetical protein